jgi:hypothetical protein
MQKSTLRQALPAYSRDEALLNNDEATDPHIELDLPVMRIVSFRLLLLLLPAVV